jgi:hypothetical protein
MVGVSIFIAGGIAINCWNRLQQGKKSMKREVVDDFKKCRSGQRPVYKSFILTGIFVLAVFVGCIVLTSWFIVRKKPFTWPPSV